MAPAAVVAVPVQGRTAASSAENSHEGPRTECPADLDAGRHRAVAARPMADRAADEAADTAPVAVAVGRCSPVKLAVVADCH